MSFYPPRRFAPLVLLEGTVLLSGLGNSISYVAIPWLVLERTGQAVSAGILGAATAIPLVLSALVAGSIVDFVGRRTTSVVSDLLSALSVILIPLTDRWFGLDMGLIVVLAVLGSCFDPVGATARESMVPEVGARAGWSMERTNAVHEATWGASYLVGPALGGVLIAAVGPAAALWATAAGFILASVAALFLRVPGAGRPPAAGRPRSVLSGATDGVRLIWNDPLLRTMTVLSMVIVAVYLPIEGVILPFVFQQQGRPAALGLVLAAMAAGSIGGALGYAVLGQRVRRSLVFAGAIVAASLSILGMALAPTYALLVGAAALAGAFWGPVDPLINYAVQTRSDPARRGRAIGVLMASYYAAVPLSYLAVGLAVERVGPRWTFAVTGILLVLVCVAASRLPVVRQLDEAPRYTPEVDTIG